MNVIYYSRIQELYILSLTDFYMLGLSLSGNSPEETLLVYHGKIVLK